MQREQDPLELARREFKCAPAASSSVRVKVVTANVLTLHPSEERKVGHNSTARSRELQHLADRASVDILGVQEARTVSARREGDQYVILSSGSDGRGNCGCEAWFAVRLLRDGATLAPWVSSPRFLGVALRSRRLSVDVLVAHAPVESSPQEVRTEWWRALHKAASCRKSKAPLILLVDANGRLGSVCTESVGDVEPDIESPNGEELHLFLMEWQLFAANTFWPLGQGTWQSTRGTQCRSDYVCLPLQWKNGVVSCSIDTEIPLALASKVDHFPVQSTVSVGGFSPFERVVPRRALFFDRSVLRTEQCRERVTFMLEQTPCLPVEFGIEKQTSLLAKWFRCVLASVAPRCSSNRKHKWLSQGAWSAICAGAQVRKLMFSLRRRAKLVWLGCVFNGWRSCQSRAVLVWCKALLLQARLEVAYASYLLEQHRKVVRHWLRADWAAELRQCVRCSSVSSRSWSAQGGLRICQILDEEEAGTIEKRDFSRWYRSNV